LLHQGSIGDFVLTLSVVQAVRAALPTEHAHVAAVASTSAARLAAGRSAVDAWVSPEQVGLHTLFSQDGPVDARLATLLAEADLLLSFLGDPCGPRHRRLQQLSSGRVISVDPRPTPDLLTAGRHVTWQWLEAIRRQGMDVGEAAPAVIQLPGRQRFGYPGRAATQLANLLAVHPQTPVAPASRRCDSGVLGCTLIHPGSGGPAKCWPLDRFITLADALTDAAITWMLGPAELDGGQDCVARLRQRAAARGQPLVIEEDLVEAARWMAGADLYVGNDSGMTHVAAALGVPVVAIFGPTDPRVWRPLGDHITVLAPAHPGEAITTIEPQTVAQAISADSPARGG